MTAIRDRQQIQYGEGNQDLIQVHLTAAGSDPFRDQNVARLFKGQRLTRARRAQLRESHMIIVSYGRRLAGVAAYTAAKRNVCVVSELALDPKLSCERDCVVDAVLDALEAACLASGRFAIVVLRTDIAPVVFKRRGYVAIIERCGGAWLEKQLSPRRADQPGSGAIRSTH